MMRGAALPAGMVRVTAGERIAIARPAFEADARLLLAGGSFHDVAAELPAARRLQGRGAVYDITLPVSGTRVVVRRNRHGGAFAGLTGDRFLPPTRAPLELRISDRLRTLGVPTPEVLMYGITPARFPFLRADVVTRHLGDGADLGVFMLPDAPVGQRHDAWRAAGILVEQLTRAGARHHDLNVKNIYIDAGHRTAYLLDVDRVTFGTPGDPRIRRANVERLQRSARKWRDTRGAVLDERDLPTPDASSGTPPADPDAVATSPT